MLAKSYWMLDGGSDGGTVTTNGISIEEEANAGYQDHDPLIRLAIDGLVDLSHAHMAILAN